MSDYELGRAHGEIEIDADVDVTRALAALRVLQARIDGLGAHMETVGKISDRFEKKVQKAGESLQPLANKARNAGSAIGGMGASIAKTVGSLTGLDKQLSTLKGKLEVAKKVHGLASDFGLLALRIDLANRKLVGFGNMSKTALGNLGKNLGKRFLGFDKAMEDMPKWSRNIVKFASIAAGAGTALVALGGGARVLRARMMTLIGPIVGLATTYIPGLASATTFLGNKLGKFGRDASGMTRGLNGILQGAGKMVLGFALMKNALGDIFKYAKIAGIGLAGLAVSGSALSALGTVVVGLVSSVKQLSGALLILPGAYAIAGAAFATFKLAIGGLEDVMKGISEDDASKFEESIKDLSPALQQTARTARAAYKEFKELRSSVQENFFRGMDQEIAILSMKTFPLLENRMGKVALSFGKIRRQLSLHLVDPKTMQDTNRLFVITQNMLDRVAMSTRPLLGAFQDIGMEGAESILRLSGGMQGATERFQRFIAEARKTGELRQWILDGVRGFKDLWSVLKDTGAIIRTVSESFSNFSGGSALAKMADSMAKFRDSVEASANGGALAQFADKLSNFSSAGLGVAKTLIESIAELSERAAPFVQQLTQGFSGGLKDAISGAASVLGVFFSALSKGQFGEMIGYIAGLVVQFKLILFVIGPIIASVKLLVGAFTLMAGAKTTLTGLSAVLGVIGQGTGTAAAAAGKASTAFGGMASVMGGPLLIAIVAVIAAFSAWRSYEQQISQYNQHLAESSKNAALAVRGIGEAFEESGGKFSPEVFDAVGKSIDTMFDKIDNSIQDRAGFWDRVGGTLKDAVTSDGWAGNEKSAFEQNKAMNASNDAAKRTKEAFDELKLTQDDLTKAVTGTSGEYDLLVSRLRTTTYGGGEAIAELQKQRQAFLDIQASMERIGPSAIQLGEAVGTLADKASTVSDKLDAMKSALQALGLLQVSEVEAFKQVDDALSQLSQTLNTPLGPAEQLGKELLNAEGALKATNPAARELWNRMGPLSDSLRSVAASGGDVNAAWRQMQPELKQLQAQTQLGDADFKKLIETMGFVPETLKTLYKLEGASQAEQDIFNLQLKLKGLQVGVETRVQIKSDEAIEKLRDLGIWVERVKGSTTGEVKLKLNNEEERQKVQAFFDDLNDNGRLDNSINVSVKPKVDGKTNASARKDLSKPVDVPVKPKLADGSYGQGLGVLKPKDEGQPAPKKSNSLQGKKNPRGLPLPGSDDDEPQNTGPKVNVPSANIGRGGQAAPEKVPGQGEKDTDNNKHFNVEVSGTDAAIGAVNAVRAALEAAKAENAETKLNLEVSGTDAAIGAINAVRTALAAAKGGSGSTTLDLKVQGTTPAIGAINAVRDALNAAIGANGKTVLHFSIDGIEPALGALNSINISIENVKNVFVAKIAEIANAFNTIVTKVSAVAGSVTGILTVAATNAVTSGQSLGQGFATGIASKEQAVRDAALKLAKAASDPLPRSPAKIGPFSGKGWTPFRGAALAVGFADGIRKGAPKVQDETLNFVDMISEALRSLSTKEALDDLPNKFKWMDTEFDENRTPGASGKRFYRDPDVTDEELVANRKKRQEAQDDKDELANYKLGLKVPEYQDKFNKAREALDKAQKKYGGKTDQKSIEALQKARDRMSTASDNLEKAQNAQKGISSGGSSTGGSFSAGGLTDDELARMGGSAINKSILEALRGAGYKTPLTAGKTDHEDDGGLHPQGKAVDIAPDDEAVKWLYENRKQLGITQIIYGGAGGQYTYANRPGEGVYEGQRAIDYYGSGVVFGQHSNHAHIGADSPINFSGMKNVPESLKKQQGQGKQVTVTTGSGKTIPLIQNPDGTYTSSDPEWAKLINRESGGNFSIVQGITDANSGGNEASGGFQITKGTWAANGGLQYAPTAGQATPEQQALIAAKIFERSGGAPWGAGMAGRESDDLLRKGLVDISANTGLTASNTGNTADSSDDTAKELAAARAKNKTLDNALKTVENSNSSNGEVIRALQDISDTAITSSPLLKKELNSTVDSVLEDRGLKEYDPRAEAYKTPMEAYQGILKAGQSGLSLFNTAESGMKQAQATFELMARGLENTNDVHTLIDGFQSMAESVGQIITTVGELIEFAGKVAATAGQAIPGIGQIAAIIGEGTGILSVVNSTIDFIQDVTKIGMRFLGTALSWLAGGKNGPLTGKVRTLLDTNDQTIKTWSQDNSSDKRSTSYDPFNMIADNPAGGSGINNLNVYANPNAPADEIINEAMYAVRSSGQGAYSD